MPNAVTHDTREERFNALYTQFKQTVRRRIEFVLKDNYELFDDIEQDTWLKVWRHFTPEKKTGSAWLSMIATNTAIDALRKKYHVGNNGYGKKRQQRPLPASLDTNPAAYLCIEAAGSEIDRFLLLEEIRENLSLMSPEYRQFCLLFADGMTYVEIMRRFNISKRMVGAIIRQLHERSRKARAEALA